MFKIDTTQNTILKIEPKKFVDLGFKERAHLQEWIAKSPNSLGENLLIIQKEFSGFSDTNERLDLLALDESGSLVIIENKLDDSGRDVTWQAIKYASYCSRLKKDDIAEIYQTYLNATKQGSDAKSSITAFLGAEDFDEVELNKLFTQRVILIGAKFRKEVTSTVLWLSGFKLRIQCIKATAYASGDDVYLTLDQIIPTKDSEEFMIGLAEKSQDELRSHETEEKRYALRRDFWTNLLSALRQKTPLYDNISPGKRHWISASSGAKGIGLNFVATRSYARAEVYIDRSNTSENQLIFEELIAQRIEIEQAFGGPLIWEPLPDRNACRIKSEAEGNILDKQKWPAMISFMTDAMTRLEAVFKSRLEKASRNLNSV
jgi:hypothetical protein